MLGSASRRRGVPVEFAAQRTVRTRNLGSAALTMRACSWHQLMSNVLLMGHNLDLKTGALKTIKVNPHAPRLQKYSASNMLVTKLLWELAESSVPIVKTTKI
eukprot:4154193-Pleurochrysis_carterae.AAC.5